ncbi:hypothetical protein C1645_777957 [Glomus cerebriforme]|uniref:Uncharacterized protein n=1 Tax=Glomus cerebriforme TaxID=658196 RepID=A0A397SR83_9GLOM|nr:hypothetical protein C1645_777957 [Glomus cerebriforme]
MKIHKTEPSSFLFFRWTVIILSLSFLIASFVILIIKMVNERPTISTTYTAVDSVLAPAVNISYDFNFKISCLIYYDYYGTVSKPCDEYVNQPVNMGYIYDHPFVGSFIPGNNIYLAKTANNSDTTKPSYIFLNINVMDPTITSNYSFQDSVYRLYAYDSSTQYNDSLTPFGESLYYTNKFVMANRQTYKLGYFRKIRNTLKQTAFSYIGFPKKYITLPYIESIIQSTPMGSLNPNDVSVRINPRSFIIEEEQEQRGDSILSIFGTIAAFYSSMVFIYVFLFGVDLVRPWGIAHIGCCGFKKLENETKEKLIKAVTPPDLESGMENRIILLEEFNQFLRENVVDVSLLERERKKREKKP